MAATPPDATAETFAPPPSPFTALAVCGCGHEGRLGIGSDASHTLHEIVLIDDFLPSCATPTSASAPSANAVSSSSVSGTIRQIACGAYHTLVLTTDGLYGWGRHAEGQLGLGCVSPDSVRLAACLSNDPNVTYGFYNRPTRIPFFECIREAEGGEVQREDTGEEEIVAVYCGADHSMVRTTHALYVTGRNADGQLGLGHTDTIFQWTRLVSFLKAEAGVIASDLHMPAFTRADGVVVRVLQGRVTHVSCGTHHTLLALADAVVLSCPSRAQCSATPQLSFHSALVLACGRGDFGELGFNEVVCIADGKAAPQQPEKVPSSTKHYAFSWGPAKNAKPRRLPYSSSSLRPVELTIGAVRRLPDAIAADIHSAFQLATASGSAVVFHLSSTAAGRDVAASLCSFISPNGKGEEEVVFALQAMHHHSSITLCTARSGIDVESDRSHKGEHASGSPLPSSFVSCRVLHWGCYYCGAVEDAAAATPRLLSDGNTTGGVSDNIHWGIHAGEEVLFRYAIPSAGGNKEGDGNAPPLLQVMGSGNIGRGSCDDEATTWANVDVSSSFLAVKKKNRSESENVFVAAVAGRSHFLLSLNANTTTCDNKDGDEACVAVLGFGENLHGQIGSPVGRRTSAEEAKDDEDDVVIKPRVVLALGDALRAASAAKASAPVPARAAAATNGVVSAQQRWAVEKIRAVGAGARHSVFLVDVRPVAES